MKFGVTSERYGLGEHTQDFVGGKMMSLNMPQDIEKLAVAGREFIAGVLLIPQLATRKSPDS